MVHAGFEDWLFAAGYYLCVLFWALTFVLFEFLPWPRLQAGYQRNKSDLGFRTANRWIDSKLCSLVQYPERFALSLPYLFSEPKSLA